MREELTVDKDVAFDRDRSAGEDTSSNKGSASAGSSFVDGSTLGVMDRSSRENLTFGERSVLERETGTHVKPSFVKYPIVDEDFPFDQG